jgi:hypothetical protein
MRADEGVIGSCTRGETRPYNDVRARAQRAAQDDTHNQHAFRIRGDRARDRRPNGVANTLVNDDGRVVSCLDRDALPMPLGAPLLRDRATIFER